MAKKSGNETGGAIVKLDNFPLFAVGAAADVLAQNLGDTQLSWQDLDRVRMPSGGGLSWTVVDAGGERAAEHLDGVILYMKSARVYWSQSLKEGGSGSPPDCTSNDAIAGIGKPGGQCAVCPFAQFGSDGRAQACKQVKQLFLLTELSMMPAVVSIPPTGLRDVNRYILRLKVPYWHAITRLGLEKRNNRDGIAYSAAVLRQVGDVPAEQAKTLNGYRQSILPHLTRTPVATSDYNRGEES